MKIIQVAIQYAEDCQRLVQQIQVFRPDLQADLLIRAAADMAAGSLHDDQAAVLKSWREKVVWGKRLPLDPQ